MVKEKLSYEWVMIFVMSIGCLYFVLITFLNKLKNLDCNQIMIVNNLEIIGEEDKPMRCIA